MQLLKKKEDSEQTLWVISEGRPSELDLGLICKEPVSGVCSEYEISQLAQYLLNPNPVHLEERVVGCRLHHRSHKSGLLRRIARRLFPISASAYNSSSNEEIISSSKLGDPSFKDPALTAHFMKIIEQLRPFDPVYKRLKTINRDDLDDITAVCEDIGRNRHQLNLQGSMKDKSQFVCNSLSRKVPATFARAYLLNGLFELRGFDFSGYCSDMRYRLIRITDKQAPRYCVISWDNQFLYWVREPVLTTFLQIFEQCIRNDRLLSEALLLCTGGGAQPLKLFFSNRRDHKYTETYLPQLYRELIREWNVGRSELQKIINILNNFQNIVSFTYIPHSGQGKGKLCTTISVMHDIKALEPIRASLPRLYSHIDRISCVSDAGRLYLLDSLRGYQNV